MSSTASDFNKHTLHEGRDRGGVMKLSKVLNDLVINPTKLFSVAWLAYYNMG